jgi:hypothetical protein
MNAAEICDSSEMPVPPALLHRSILEVGSGYARSRTAQDFIVRLIAPRINAVEKILLGLAAQYAESRSLARISAK